MTTTMNPAEIARYLNDAADTLIECGLWNGDHWVGDKWGPRVGSAVGKPCCVVGAIGVALGYIDSTDVSNLVAGDHQHRDQVHPVVGELMDHLGFQTTDQLFAWNDACPEDQPERIATQLRAAAITAAHRAVRHGIRAASAILADINAAQAQT